MRRLDTGVAAYVMAGCAVILTVTLLYRVLSAPTPPDRPRPPAAVEYLPGWERLAEVGHFIGPEEAPLRVIVFSDFECPACRQFALETFPGLLREYPGRVGLTYRHFPLQQHRFSYHAARASECASAQGAFIVLHDLLFANQDSLGLKSLRDLAAEGGIPDIDAFDACLWSDAPVPTIDRDVEAARSLGALGTPTIIINGTLLRSADRHLIDSIARTILER